jgi:hypothetical protein
LLDRAAQRRPIFSRHFYPYIIKNIMAKIKNKNGAFQHIKHFGLKKAVMDIAVSLKDISEIHVCFDLEQRAKISAAASEKNTAELTYVALAKVGSSERGKNYDFSNQKLAQAIAKAANNKAYGVDYVNGYLVVKGSGFVPPQRPSAEPIEAGLFKATPAPAALNKVDVKAEAKAEAATPEKAPKKEAKKAEKAAEKAAENTPEAVVENAAEKDAI